MALPSAADLLKVQLARSWTNTRWVLEGLDDDEWRWEPVSPCWSVRRREPGIAGWGSGEFVCEDIWPPPDPVPVTTIAWRVVHLAAWTDIYRDWTFGDATAHLRQLEVPGDVEGGLDWLFGAQDRFSAEVDALDDEAIFELRPAHWGELLPVARLVASMLDEHVHHVAEVGVIRDLRRGRARAQWPPAEPTGPPWWQARPGTFQP